MEPSYSGGERLRCLRGRADVTDGCDIGGCGGVLILLTLLEGTGRGNLGIQGLELGAVGIEVAQDEAGGVRVVAVVERVGFP